MLQVSLIDLVKLSSQFQKLGSLQDEHVELENALVRRRIRFGYIQLHNNSLLFCNLLTWVLIQMVAIIKVTATASKLSRFPKVLIIMLK